MVSNDSLGRAEKRLGTLPVIGRYHRSPKELQDDYSLQATVLGRGASGKVLLGTCRRTGVRVAVKSLSVAALSKEKRQVIENEAEIFLSMDHPRVARLLDVYETDGRLSFVMECMEGGELFARVLEREVFSEAQAADATWQMLLALNYVHSQGIVHRDIKLENFMYAKKETDHLKLIDFGLSKAWEPNTRMHASCGTLGYIAPEVLDKSYTASKCDLWSLGVIVYVLLSGCMPFAGSQGHQITCIMSGMYDMDSEEWANISVQAKDFVKKLLVVDPAIRLSAAEALEHPWINSREQHTSGAFDKSIIEAFRRFEHETKFRRACLSVMAWSLTHEERKSVVDAFVELDVSKTGTLKLCEFRDVLKGRFGVQDEEAAEIFHCLDTSHVDEVHYSDFLAAMVSSRIAMHEHLLKGAFARLDIDGSGYITFEKTKHLLGESLDCVIVEKAFDEMGCQGSSGISFQDFAAYLRGPAATEHLNAANQVIDAELAKQQKAATPSVCDPDDNAKRRRLMCTEETHSAPQT